MVGRGFEVGLGPAVVAVAAVLVVVVMAVWLDLLWSYDSSGMSRGVFGVGG